MIIGNKFHSNFSKPNTNANKTTNKTLKFGCAKTMCPPAADLVLKFIKGVQPQGGDIETLEEVDPKEIKKAVEVINFLIRQTQTDFKLIHDETINLLSKLLDKPEMIKKVSELNTFMHTGQGRKAQQCYKDLRKSILNARNESQQKL